MNALLSIIVCFALLMSPTGTLPAQPETAATWTLSNLTIAVGDESVTLNPEARLTTAVGMEEAQLHFELGSGERVLMPMSGAINKDGVRFTLGTGTKAYTLSNENLMEIMGMTEQDAQIVDVFGDFFLSYGKLLSTLKDEEKYAAYYDLSWELMEDMLGAEFVETEVEVDGEMLPGLQISGGLTLAGMLNMLDVLGECEIPELKEFTEVMLELVNLSSGESIEKFSDLAALIEEEEDLEGVIMEMDCAYTTGDILCSKMNMSMDVAGQKMTAWEETLTSEEETLAVMVMEMNTDETSMYYTVNMNCTGPVTAPTSLNLAYDIYTENDYSITSTDADGGEIEMRNTGSTGMHMTMKAEAIDGLQNVEAEIIADNSGSFNVGEEVETYEETVTMNLTGAERLEEDGSITAACALDVNIMDETIGISFELNRAEGEVVDFFADTTEQPLTADTQDAGYNALMMDVVGVAADAMALAADSSVMALEDMFESLGEDVEDYLTDDKDTHVDLEDLTDYDETVVSTYAEAAAIFDGEIPAYTAPEGYELKEIEVDEYSLYAIYAAGEREFELCAYAYDSDLNYYSMEDGGVFTPIDGRIVEFSMYEDEVGSASVYSDGREVIFYFSGVDMDAAQAIVAGLN